MVVAPTPPAYEYDERGLVKGRIYAYRSDGTIDWRRMIEPRFLGIKKEREEQVLKLFNKPLAEVDVAQLPDDWLIIKLGGTKRLASLRGYESATHRVDHVSDNRCVITCTIQWAPNFEHAMRSVTRSEVRSATFANTSGNIAQLFLEATAANRSFVSAVRSFLNIDIVSDEEMEVSMDNKKEPSSGGAAEGSAPATTSVFPHDMLSKRCAEAKPAPIPFEGLKALALTIKDQLKTDPATWTQWSDVPGLDAYTLANVVMGPPVVKDTSLINTPDGVKTVGSLIAAATPKAKRKRRTPSEMAAIRAKEPQFT